MTRPTLLAAAALVAAAITACGSPTSAGLDASTTTPPDATTAAPDTGLPPGLDAGAADAAGAPDAGGGCWTCHGTPASPAPPPDLSGSSDRSRAGVGAHAQHLAASTWRHEVLCTHCHVVPAASDTAHGKGGSGPATVTFQGLPAAGVTPSYAGGTCSVYCHGAKMVIGGPRLSPAWTSTAPTTCTSCHGMPPAAPHPVATDCGRCHLDVADPAGKIISASRHIDGYLMSPKGAHLIHLGGAGGSTYDCVTCHDGDRYHGLLKDQQPLETTTVCDACHPTDAAAKRAAWETWTPP